MAYPFCCNITDSRLGVIVITDFECEVEVDVTLSDGALECTVIDVLIDCQSLRLGDDATRALFGKVANLADDEIANGGALWEAIQGTEGLAYRGLGGDPDGRWVRA